MQYTPHYNLNLPEGTDIVNPLIQDNPNYSAIDTALYDNKLRVIGTATHTKTGTNHSIVLSDSDINAFKFVATGDYATGDTFTVDGVNVTPRVADGSTIPNGAFKINSTVECIIDGTILNLINVTGTIKADVVSYDNTSSGLSATTEQAATDELAAKKANFCTVAAIETAFTMSGTSQSYTVQNTGHYIITLSNGAGSAHDMSVLLGGVSICGQYSNYLYQKASVSIPLKAGTVIDILGAAGDLVSLNFAN